MKCQKIMDVMEGIAPKRLAEEWDNVGLLVGSPLQEVHKILVCLDVSDAVVERAVREGAELIVAHHPLIFKAMKKLRTDLPEGRRLAVLLKHDIAVFAAHTNLDITRGGVNDVLATALGVEKLSPFVITQQEDDGTVHSLGRMGALPAPVALEDFAMRVKSALSLSHVRIVEVGERPVRKIALCGGSGAEFIDKAAFLGADVYVTGDVKYHDAQRAVERGMHVVDAGHFGTEFPAVHALAERLREALAVEDSSVEILEDHSAQDFFRILD